ncbi:dephospho-CoA kinase [Dechloromonas sp. ZY10]|uniref:dephospho-CoA kinase n=1 Tax=Dechloromonas aquae TaxID=2664436 RepID=UPI0035277B4D
MSAYVVGLTGGVGSGKSTVANWLVEQGAGLVDTDAIAHELTAPGGGAMAALIASFGADIATPDGALDRAAMRRRVFADPAARRQLEAVLHPMIRQVAEQRCHSDPAPYVLLAVPLLVESGAYRRRCDRILVVDCPVELQLARVMLRNGLSSAEAQAIISAQATREQRLAIADDIVLNASRTEDLHAPLCRLHTAYLAQAAEKAKANH